MVTFLGLLVQSCCGEGGTLQTNNTGVCSHCLSHTGFSPGHSVCSSPVYTAQALGCSAGNCLRQALGCVHFPGLSRSGSGSQVLLKGADSVGPAFCDLPRSEQLRRPGAWRAQSPPGGGCVLSPSLLLGFLGKTCVPSQVCAVSLLGSWSLAATLLADVDHPESQEVLVSNKACLQFGRGCLSGAMIAPFWLRLPPPACLQRGLAGLQPASSAQSFVMWAGLAVS